MRSLLQHLRRLAAFSLLAFLPLPPAFAMQVLSAPQPAFPSAPEAPPISHFIPTPAGAPANSQPASPKTPDRLRPAGLDSSFFGLIGPFRPPRVPPLLPGTGTRVSALIHDDKLFLSLHDAIALALENNLDVEIESGATPRGRTRQPASRAIDQSPRRPEPDLPRPGAFHRDRRPQHLGQKARIELDRATGGLLEKNNIDLDAP